jgi:membrane associated rhomboid family serine protease
VRYANGPRMPFNFGPSLTPTVKALLAANISVFVLQFLMGQSEIGLWFDSTFGLVPRKVFGQLHIWQFASYMFLHVNFFHILFNMFVLWMFGSELETLWGRKAFLQYYLVTGIGAGLTYVLIMPLLDANSSYHILMGASGAIYGLLAAYAMIYPNRKIMLYFLIPVPMRWFALGLVVIEMMSMLRASNVGHLAHLGGLLVGYLYLRGGRRYFDNFLKARRKKKASSRFHVVDDKKTSRPSNGSGKGGQTRVDQILEKISTEGLDSLTQEEQDILRRASRH